MLITRSTPRITYRIGMRAWFGVLADKFLPSLIADAEGEVAAAFKGILKILMGNLAGKSKSWLDWHYQSTVKAAPAWVCGGSDFRPQISDFVFRLLRPSLVRLFLFDDGG